MLAQCGLNAQRWWYTVMVANEKLLVVAVMSILLWIMWSGCCEDRRNVLYAIQDMMHTREAARTSWSTSNTRYNMLIYYCAIRSQ